MSQLDPIDVTATLIGSFVKTAAAHQIADVVADLAMNGRLDILETVFKHELIPTSTSSNNWCVSYAVLPILAHVAPSQNEQAKALVDGWTRRHGQVGYWGMREVLTGLMNPNILHHAVLQGGKEMIEDTSSHALMRDWISRESHQRELIALLTACQKIGFYAPVQLAITRTLDKGMSRYFNDLAAALYDAGASECIDQPTREKVVGTISKHCDSFRSTDFQAEKKYRAVTWAHLLNIVKPTRDDWNELITAWNAEPHFITMLTTSQKNAEIAAGLASTAMDAGIVLSDIPSLAPGKRDPVPMLHSAAAAGNHELVELLLKLGADASQTVKYAGKQKTPAELAAPDGMTRNLLNAWAARQAMAQAIKPQKSIGAP